MAMRIERLEITGFRCLSKLSLDFRDPTTGAAPPFVAIVGPNGSGKTAILEAIVNGARHHLGQASPDKPDGLRIEFAEGEILALPPRPPLTDRLREALQSHSLYQPAFRDPQIPGQIVQPGQPQRFEPDLALSGQSSLTPPRAVRIHNWLMARQISRDRIPELWDATRPFLDGFEFHDVDPRTFDLRFRKSHTVVNFTQLSGGQRMIIFNFAEILMQCGDGGLLLIDEPEQHLHPAWQRALPAALQLLIRSGQIIVATHSPYIVHGLAPHQVFVLGDVGETVA